MEELTTCPVPLVYAQETPDAPIDLGEHAIEVQVGDFVSDAKLHSSVLLSPKPGLEMQISGLGSTDLMKSWSPDSHEPWRVRLLDRDVTIECFWISQRGSEPIFEVSPYQSAILASKASKTLSYAIAHLINFPKFYGPSDFIHRSSGAVSRRGMVLLEADDWRITITGNELTDSRCKFVEETEGYAITHAARIERVDGSLFTSQELDEQLTVLHTYLSFALGRWSGLFLPVGYDADGEIAHCEWGSRMQCAGLWPAAASWFDVHHAEILSVAFPGFCRLLKNRIWKGKLNEVLWWYVAANERASTISVDMAIVLAHAALELMAWLYCVQDRRLVSKEAFKPNGLRGSDKLRLLMTALKVPTEIPDNLPLLKRSSGKTFEDVPHAISEMRNDVVHPDSGSISDEAWVSGWKLSMWTIDLIFLSLCEHRGDYANRLARRGVGTVEPVPWSDATPP